MDIHLKYFRDTRRFPIVRDTLDDRWIMPCVITEMDLTDWIVTTASITH